MTALKSKKVLLLAVEATMAVLVTGGSIYAATIQYEYDALNRLIRVIYDENTSIEYIYDAVGNRTRRVVIWPYHSADPDNDNVISMLEILSYIDQWALGNVSMLEVLEGIDLWAAGHYYWDPVDEKFKPGETKVASWISGEQGPTWWTISPVNPTTGDVIYFSDPTGVYSNDCFAEGAAGGSPVITVNVLNHVIELRFQSPAPELCPLVWDPVCGIEGDFGPLEAGEWLFFGTDLFASLHIPFTITVQPTLILSI